MYIIYRIWVDPQTGWGVLDLVGNDQNSQFDANDVYYAVGMIEGYLTATRIKQNARTMHEYWNLGDKEQKIKQFFADQWNWANSQVTENKKDWVFRIALK